MSQKSCSATGPVSKHSSKQGEEVKKRHSPRGSCLFFVRRFFLSACSFGASLMHFVLHCSKVQCFFILLCLSPLLLRRYIVRFFVFQYFIVRCFILCASSCFSFQFGAFSFCSVFHRLLLRRYIVWLPLFFSSPFVLCLSALRCDRKQNTFRISCFAASLLSTTRTYYAAFRFIMSTFCILLLLKPCRAFDSPPGCALPSRGQAPLSPAA